jgi:hypothetical protein
MTLGSIRFLEDNDYMDDIMMLHVNVNNRGNDYNIKNAKVRFLVLDHGLGYSSSTQNTIRSGDMSTKIARGEVFSDNLEPGEHMIRIYVYGDDGVRRIRHRPIIVQ